MRKIQTRMLRQDLPGATKRWYTDDGSDLLTWTDPTGRLLQFQWGFRQEGQSYVLEWRRSGGSQTFRVSDEENLGAPTTGMKPSPMMQPLSADDGVGPRDFGRELLLSRIAGLPEALALALRLALENVTPEARP